jgi:Zn-dependent protease with chaperone function
MLINKNYIRENITLISIILFIFMFGLIVIIKPGFLYNRNGSIREFGIGYKNKTILPIWLLSLILGIVSYLLVMFYLASPKIF